MKIRSCFIVEYVGMFNDERRPDYANVKNEYDELSELLLRKFLEREESMFIRCPFKHMKAYSNYNKYEDELVNLYVERIWTVASNEVIILFKNGSMVREKWDF